VGTDLRFFDTIVPCGLPDHGVTSLERFTGRPADTSRVRERLVANFAEVFDREVVPRDVTSRSVQVLVWHRGTGGGRVLLLHRTERDGGFWQPVTGIIERGETPEDAARREVAEETGLGGAVADLSYVRDFRIDRRYVGGTGAHPWINREHAFAVELPREAPVRLSPQEHREYLWTGLAEAREKVTWNGNRRALDRLERRIAEAA
jgi:lipoyl(octanoyl) transferase